MKRTPLSLKRLLVVLLCGMSLTFANLTAYGATITRYVHTDRLGNPVAKTNSVGVVVWRQSYTPYGEANTRAELNGPGFTGHRYDADTGLVYMQARYYDPKISRFLSPDPVTFSPDKPQFFNRYWYANGNPYRYTDPDGRCAICAAMAIGAGIGAAINIGAQLLHGSGSIGNRFSNLNWKQVGVAAAAGALGGFAGSVASSATTTAGMIGANAVAGAAIGAGAVHASAAVEGNTASTADVVKGAITGGILSGAAGAAGAAGKALSKATSASMTGTQKVANGNLLRGVANTTRSGGGNPDFTAPRQGAASAGAEVISNSSNIQAQPKKDDLQQ